MIWQLGIIYDLKARTTFGPILAGRNINEIARNYQDIVSTKDTLPNKHPEDFALFHIGTLNDEIPALDGQSAEGSILTITPETTNG